TPPRLRYWQRIYVIKDIICKSEPSAKRAQYENRKAIGRSVGSTDNTHLTLAGLCCNSPFLLFTNRLNRKDSHAEVNPARISRLTSALFNVGRVWPLNPRQNSVVIKSARS